MYEIDIEKDFSAAHQLHGYPGNCAAIHGHNWSVTAVIGAGELDEIGLAFDFRKLKQALDEVISELDHTHLNTLPYFADKNPTSEVLAKYIFEALGRKINDDRVAVKKIRVRESRGAGASYYE